MVQRTIITVDNRFSDDNPEKFWNIHSRMTEAYCQKHGYEFAQFTADVDNDFSFMGYGRVYKTWYKILPIKDVVELALRRGESLQRRILFLDSDAVFNLPEFTIEQSYERLTTYTGDHVNPHESIIMYSNKPFEYDLPCSFYMDVLVSEKTLEILNQWVETIHVTRYREKMHAEQASLQDIIYPEFKDEFQIIDEWTSRNYDHDFIHHYTYPYRKVRALMMKEVMKRNYKGIIS